METLKQTRQAVPIGQTERAQKLDVKSKKSLRDHGIIVDGGSIRLINPEAKVRATARLVMDMLKALRGE